MSRWITRAAIALTLLALVACQSGGQRFDGQRALRHVETQVGFGPRPVGSEANRKTSDYIGRTLQRYGWEVEYQEFAHSGLPVRNVIGKKGSGPLILLGTHFDTRPVADRDPSDRTLPVPGANDGASGVGVLLELARVLDKSATDQAEIWLAFFDAEDRGGLNDWPWCVGSTHMADRISLGLTPRPAYVIIIDMIGDADQQIYYEWTSTLWLQEKLWGIAHDLGYGQYFIPKHRYTILDDHSSFLKWGIPAALMIDFDYPAWHTRYDTLDKISADSLQRVGDVLQTLLKGEPFAASPATPGLRQP
jgi:glutaminyl-peptide cyclotransferase